MNEEGTMDVTTMTETIPALDRIRADLVAAVARDRSRAARRRKAGMVAFAAAVAVGLVGSAIAAATGAFSPAPGEIRQTFADLDVGGGIRVDSSRAVEIGVIDEHRAYAAPADNGGFCLYFAPNPRSGPTGGSCVSTSVGEDEIVLNVSVGHDGGFVFGRVGTPSAATIEVRVPEGGTLTTPVREDRFFLAEVPARALPALFQGEPVTATARDANGATVASSKQESLPVPGTPTETTETVPAGTP